MAPVSPHSAPNSLDRHGPAARPKAWKPLAAMLLVAAAALLAHGPIGQWPDYHAFADVHMFWGLPNGLNVLSNLPFAAIGLLGLAGLWRLRRDGAREPAAVGPGFTAWVVFALAITCTAFGSAHYHWAPDNTSLVWDRLPIAWACAALSCGLLAERLDARFGKGWALAAALLGSSASVGLWWWTLAPHGALEGGDLRAYLAVQFLPMLLIPLLMRQPASHAHALSGRAAWTALALYAAAKAFEMADHAVMQTLHAVGGHPLKHLLAAAGAAALLWAVARPREGAGQLR